MGTEKRPGTMVYFNLLDPVEALNMEERGQLFTAILQYGSKGEEPVFSGMLHMAWLFVKRDMDLDKERYSSRCEKSRKAAESRWKEKNTEEKPGMRSDASALDECERINADTNALADYLAYRSLYGNDHRETQKPPLWQVTVS